MNGLFNAVNFLVPATGTTRGYIVSEVLSATPKNIDFRTIAIDGVPYIPSGVIADNTAGAGDLVIVINEINFTITIPAGKSMQLPYPAPMQQSVSITGNGQATVVFVDYPVMPFAY